MGTKKNLEHTRSSIAHRMYRGNVGLALLLAVSALHGATLEQQTCNDGGCFSTFTSGLLSHPATGSDFSSLAEAFAIDYANLGVHAQLTATNHPVQIIVSAFATAQDRLFFGGASSGTVDFLFNITGQTDFALTEGYAELVVDSGLVGTPDRFDLWREITPDFIGLPIQAQLPELMITLPFSGAGFLDYRFTLSAVINCVALSSNICNGSLDADFLSGMSLSSITVRNEQGNIVFSPGITSESGFDYSPFLAGSPSEVPEPSTWILLGIGLCVLFLRRERF